MRTVFVDTSGYYAFLDRTDRYHAEAVRHFQRAEDEGWQLLTSLFVVHESWALIQTRLGWDAVEDWLGALVSRSEVIWVDPGVYSAAAARARQARERRLSLTDCASFEIMRARGCGEFIGDDEHFTQQGFHSPNLPTD